MFKYPKKVANTSLEADVGHFSLSPSVKLEIIFEISVNYKEK